MFEMDCPKILPGYKKLPVKSKETKPKDIKKEISYCLKCRKPARNKEIHETLTLVNLIKYQVLVV